MKTAEISKIVEDVRICLDEHGVNESSLIGGTDEAEMDAIIKSKIEDAIRFVYMSADLSMLEPVLWEKGEKSGEEVRGAVQLYRALLPSNYLRLCYARVPEWVRSVDSPIMYSDKEYAALSNVFTTGYKDNPKVAFVVDGTDKYLELYPSGGEPKIAYMQEPVVEEIEVEGKQQQAYSIPDKVYRGVVHYVAGLTLLTYKDQHADSLINIALQMIGAKTN